VQRLTSASKIVLALAGLVVGAAATAFVATATLTRADQPVPSARALQLDRGAMAEAGRNAGPARERIPAAKRIRWRSSVAVGLPHAGRLVRGVELPAADPTFFTWDPIKKQKPNRAWRRWGTEKLIRTILRIARGFSRENPGAPRIAVGDLSRPRGGDFGPRWGALGHASHQSGLDVDIYYPLRSGKERAPRNVSEVDIRLAQDLVDRFVAAGAVKVFVGPSTPLTGPPDIVQPLVHHDNHLHARIAP
jgi:murein endopeptidase